MRTFLINPDSHIEEKVGGRFAHYAVPVPPQGIASLAAQLRRAGHEAFCYDQYATKLPNEDLVRQIREWGADVVGFSVLTLAMGSVREAVGMLREELPDVKIVLGNVHATVFPDELLRNETADLVVRGEGEATIVDMMDTLANDGDLSEVAGLSFCRDGEIVHNPARPTIANLDSLALPEWDEFEIDRYKCVSLPMRVFEGSRALPIQASRGCPFHCTYCAQDFAGKRLRVRDLDLICDEMEHYIDRYNVDCFGFIDACFPVSKRQGRDFCEKYISRGLHKKAIWFTETRVDLVDAEVLDAMKEAGCEMVQYGFESGSDEVLKTINKGGRATTSRALQTMEATKNAKILSFGLFMLGSPGETEEDCEKTIEFARELDCDLAKFNLVVPYPGSDLFDEYKSRYEETGYDENRITGFFDWSTFSGELIYVPDGMTSERLVKLQRRALFRFYLRPALVLRYITRRLLTYREFFIGAVNLLIEYSRYMRLKTAPAGHAVADK